MISEICQRRLHVNKVGRGIQNRSSNMKHLSMTICYASAWIATAVAVIFAIKYTGSTWCLWAFLFPASLRFESE